MAFVTGSATSFSDLRTALINGCGANGWNTDGTLIWRGNCAVNVVVGTPYLGINCGTGVSGGTLVNQCPMTAMLGGSFINFPVKYDLHVFDDEVYFIVNYNNNYYQQISFGVSSVAGAGGGPWLTGARERADRLKNISAGYSAINSIGLHFEFLLHGFFVKATDVDNEGSSAIYINTTGTPGWYGYHFGATSARLSNGGSMSIVAPLLGCSPPRLNGAAVLLPIKAVIDMGSGGRAVVANLNHARFCRLDNIEVESIIQYGNDKWKVYPLLRKNENERNGVWYSGSDHSGTYGYAIRYTGP